LCPIAAINAQSVTRFCPKSPIYGGKWQFSTVRTGAFDSVVQRRLATGGRFKIGRLLDASVERLKRSIERIEVGEGQVAAVG